MPLLRSNSHTFEQQYAFIRLLTEIDSVYRIVYGDARTAAIVNCIWLGQQDGAPFDITSLAAHLDTPRQTVSHIVKRLVAEGVVERRQNGHSAVLRIQPEWADSETCNRFMVLMDLAAKIFETTDD